MRSAPIAAYGQRIASTTSQPAPYAGFGDIEPSVTVATVRHLGVALRERGFEEFCVRYAQPDRAFRGVDAYSEYLRAESRGDRLRLGSQTIWEDARTSSLMLIMLLPAPLTLYWLLRGLPWLAIVLAVLLLAGLLWASAVSIALPFWAHVAIWPVTLVIMLATGQAAGLLLTHVASLVVAVAIASTRPDRETLTLALGLVIPVTVVIVVLPLLTAEIWQLAAELSPWRLLALGAALVAPLMLIAYPRVTHSSSDLLTDVVDFSDQETKAALTAQLQSTMHRVYREREHEVDWTAADLAESALAAVHGVQTAPNSHNEFERAVESLLRRELGKRFVVIFPAAIAVLTMLFYALAALAVPPDVARDWTEADAAVTMVSILGVELPFAPYLEVSFFLALAATAIFLGFLLTEEQHVQKLSAVMFEEPAHGIILFGLPYAALAPAVIDELDKRGFPSRGRPEPLELPLPSGRYVMWW